MRLMDMDMQPYSGLCSQTGTAVCGAPPPVQQPPPAAPTAAPPAANSQHMAFLQGWKQVIAPKLSQLLTLLAGQEVARNLAVAQIWTYLPVLTEGRQLLKAEQLCLLGDVELQAFHAGCCHEGVTVSQLGPMGKVWETGAVQVVQNAESLNPDMHPCNRLPGPLADRIAECIYVPVYDRTGQVSQGVLAVVELLIRSQSHDYMVVANAISCLTHLMEALQLSLSNPHQQQAPVGASSAPAGVRSPDRSGQPPAKRAALGSNGGMQAAATSAAMQTAHNNGYYRKAAAFGSGGGSNPGSGGSLGRSMSMRTFV